MSLLINTPSAAPGAFAATFAPNGTLISSETGSSAPNSSTITAYAIQGNRALIDDRAVTLGDGEIIPAGTVVCTIGTMPNPIVAALPVAKERGRIVTHGDMSVPEFDGVWALGDCAAVPNARDGKVSPPTAQFADRQARHLAKNVTARMHGQATKAFSYQPQGQLSSIGHNKAVAEMFGIKISGFVAWLLWRGVYLLKIPTLARKTRLFLEWNWAMFFPPDISHFGYRRSRRPNLRSPG